MKKRIIFIIVLLLLIATCALGYFKIYPKYIKNKISLQEEDLIKINLEEDTFQITCAKYGNYADFIIGSINHPKMESGVPISCMIEFTNKTDEDILIKNVEFDYDIPMNDITDFTFNRLNFDYHENNNHISLNSKKGINLSKIETIDGTPISSGLPLSSFSFRLKSAPSSDKFIISIKNIKITSDKYIYNHVDHSKAFDINLETIYKYDRLENPNQFVFYKNDNNGYKEINKYECTGECFEYAAQCFSYVNLIEGKIFLVDDNKAVLFDMNKGIIGKYETPLYNIYDRSNNQYKSKYFVGKKEKNGDYGIIDYDGNIIKEYNANELGTVSVCDINFETYSLNDNLITIKKDNKYGITRITNDELLTNYQFDDIRLYNKDYYKAKLNDLWYLYNFNNELVIDKGYKQIFMPTDNILFVQDEGYIYIKDYTGKNINEEKIQVLSDYNEKACCGATYGINIFADSENNNIIYIIVDNGKISDDEFIQYKYEYNIKNNTLIKRDSNL